MTATTADRAPGLRLLAAPPFDPPYDDDPAAAPPVAGSLALSFPSAAGDAVPLRLVPPAAGPPSLADGLPDPRAWARRLAQVIVEVLVGARPAGQLAPFTTWEVLQQLERASGRLVRRTPGTPARCPVVSSVRLCRPLATAAEACAVIDTGRRRRALALRLDVVDGHWRCTAVQVG